MKPPNIVKKLKVTWGWRFVITLPLNFRFVYYLFFLQLIPEQNPTSICFHCSQTVDNFHNFATKIWQIQKIIYPVILEPEAEELFEICYDELPKQSDSENQVTFKVTTITRTNAPKIQEKVFDELKRGPSRAFDFEENSELFVAENSSDEETPSRDDETDWPTSKALQKIPTKLVENGMLLYKGKKLLRFMSHFYNTKCELCGEVFKRIASLFEHYKTQHTVEPFITCCSTVLSKMPRIIWHFVKHIQPESFKCKICGYAVSRPKFLELHLQTHTNHKPYSCDKCDKKFIWKGALKSHVINHQPESERKLFQLSNVWPKIPFSGFSCVTQKVSAHRDNKIQKSLRSLFEKFRNADEL